MSCAKDWNIAIELSQQISLQKHKHLISTLCCYFTIKTLEKVYELDMLYVNRLVVIVLDS